MTQPRDEAGEEDSSGNPVDVPTRDEPSEDEEARARPGHPDVHDNFRGDR
ncbi:hypothetical protein [Amycolatopsis kentuckyensis]